MNKFFPITLLVLLFLCHLPFLTADPDQHTDIHTRGAWTDEGLYSSQVRNYLIDGKLDLDENTTFIRGPLFSLLQIPFFSVFGSHRLIARLLVLLAVVLIPLLFLRMKGMEPFLLFFLLVVLTQFHLFYFSHYALAEMLCISLILVSLYYFLKSQADKAPFNHRVWNIFLASFYIFLSFSCKIQFIYLAALLPVSTLIMAFLSGKEREEAFQLFGLSLIFSVVFIGVYSLWYVANKDFYRYVMMQETSGRYPGGLAQLWVNVKENFRNFLWVKPLQPLWVALPVAVVVILWQRYTRKTDKPSLALWIFLFIWFLLELHKIPMTYLPNRYLLPLFFASGMIIAYALTFIFQRSRQHAWLALVLALTFAGWNAPLHYDNYRHRTHDLDKLRRYLSKAGDTEGYALGSWAAAATWDTELKSVPVWNQYLNWKDPVRHFKPRVILSEADQAETDKAYSSQGIDLNSISDSSRTFTIWRYPVTVYWIKQ